MAPDERVGHRVERVGAFPEGCVEDTVEVVWPAHRQGLQREAQHLGGGFYGVPAGIGTGRLPEHRHAGNPRDRLFEEFEPFPPKLGGHDG